MTLHDQKHLFAIPLVVLIASVIPLRVSADEEFDQLVQAAVNRVAGCIVQIETTGGIDRSALGQTRTTTSGLIVTDDGFVVTSMYGFTDSPDAIIVNLPSGERVRGELRSFDYSRKIVLLKIETDSQLPTPTFLEKSLIQVGQQSIAVGKAFDMVEPNISVGIISATRRIWGRAIQTDAKISQLNYGGPLIDLDGNVMGILSPISLELSADAIDTSLYDSGIGFAIPLEDIVQRLPRMIDGENIEPGQIGLSPSSQNLYRGDVVVAHIAAGGPAAQAGIEVGDRIIQANGNDVSRLAQLKHQIGITDAGDSIDLTIDRDGQTYDFRLTLVADIPPFQHLCLGILPSKQIDDEPGVLVKHVIDSSAAQQSGIAAGDRILAIGDQTVGDIRSAIHALAALQPNTSVEIRLFRNGEAIAVEATPSSLPADVPDFGNRELAHDAVEIDQDAPELLRLPEEDGDCVLLTPSEFSDERLYPLLVWLGPTCHERELDLQSNWQPFCDRFQVAVMIPRKSPDDQWARRDASVIRQYVELTRSRLSISVDQITIGGYESGGTLAWHCAFHDRDLYRGIATSQSMPLGIALSAQNEPLQRLLMLVVHFSDSDPSSQLEQSLVLLRTNQFSVYELTAEGSSDPDSASLKSQLGRWIEMLDLF